MLIAPDGEPFVSLGVARLANILKTEAFQSRYAADPRAACEMLAASLRAAVFNTVGHRHSVEMRGLMPFMAEVYLAQVAYWMPRVRYVDVFSPSYPKAVNNLVRKMVSAVKASPSLIGYYWTGTPRWDLDLARRQINDDWVSMIRRLPAPRPQSRHDRELFARPDGGAQPFDERCGVRRGAGKLHRRDLPGLGREGLMISDVGGQHVEMAVHQGAARSR